MKKRSVKHPEHYCKGRKYEPKDVIRDWELNFNLGSAVKHLAKAGRKGDIVEDLLKAREYIDFEVEAILNEESLAKLGANIVQGAMSTLDKNQPCFRPGEPIKAPQIPEALHPHCDSSIKDDVPNYYELFQILLKKHVISHTDFDSHK